MVTIIVRNPKNVYYTKRTGDEADLATVMILALALRGGQSKLVAELIGLAPVIVLEHLKKFYKPPFIRLFDITQLVHTTARNIAHSHDGRTTEPLRTINLVADIIASLLEFTPQKTLIQNERYFTMIFGELLSKWDDDRDRGMQVGLMFAGLRKYTGNKQTNNDQRYAKAKLFCDLMFAGLSAVPTVAPLFAVVNVAVDKMLENGQTARGHNIQELRDLVRKFYNERVDFPMVADGGVEIDGTMVVIKRDVYKMWMEAVLEWCGFDGI